MNPTVRVFLIVLVFVAIGGLAMAAAGWWWWSRHGDAFLENAKTAAKDGMVFGDSTDANGCLEESLDRMSDRNLVSDAIGLKVFLSTCLITADPSENFCEEVPRTWRERIGQSDWPRASCIARQSPGIVCEALMQGVVEHCVNEN